jgi:hypothetical protein
MHLILHYKRLGPSAVENIFCTNIERLRAIEKQQHEATGDPELHVHEPDIMRFASDHLAARNQGGKRVWNGRRQGPDCQPASSNTIRPQGES